MKFSKNKKKYFIKIYDKMLESWVFESRLSTYHCCQRQYIIHVVSMRNIKKKEAAVEKGAFQTLSCFESLKLALTVFSSQTIYVPKPGWQLVLKKKMIKIIYHYGYIRPETLLTYFTRKVTSEGQALTPAKSTCSKYF